MKKKNLNHSGLKLNKDVVSNLTLEDVKGGFTASCLQDANTNCATNNCTVPCPTGGTCPPGSNNCPSQFISCSCPDLGIC
jgi:hypothetical protein